VAQFIGTVQDFHHYIGPRIRNVINQAAAPHRKSLGGICQECGVKAELQSAHVHGRDRRMLIEGVLSQYARPDGRIQCDLDEVEKQVVEAHMPIDDTFKFICHPCHVAYDSGTRESAPRRGSARARKLADDGEFTKLHRVETWAARPTQDNHRIIRAFLELEKSGEVTREALRARCETDLGMANFAGKYASLKTDAGNSYGKVFFEQDGCVRMWPVVRGEVDRYF